MSTDPEAITSSTTSNTQKLDISLPSTSDKSSSPHSSLEEKNETKRKKLIFEPHSEFLQQLLDMGIAKNIAVKALYYTGNQNLMLATNWIFDQPTRDLETPLEEEFAKMSQNTVVCPHFKNYNKRELINEDDNDDESLEESDEDLPNYKMVFVINVSLQMTAGKISAQVGHAALGLHRKIHQNSTRYRVGVEELSIWEDIGERMIVLKGNSTEKLRELEHLAEDLCLPNYTVCDAGLTQVAPGSLTVIALFGEESEVNKVTGSLQLLS